MSNEATPSPRSTSARATQRAIVVGASSGMGAALVTQLRGEGHSVAALARRDTLLDELRAGDKQQEGLLITRVHDVIEAEEVPTLFEELTRELGGLDLLIFAAGIMPTGEPDTYDTESDLLQLQVNLGGCIAWCNEAANFFQSQRSGTIVGVSSVAGDRGRSGNPAYCTSKAGLNTYLEALRNRLGEKGVHVCTIKPGFVATPMTEGLDGLFWLISSEEAARLILKAARSRANVRYVPRKWWLIMTVIRSIPSFLFRKLNI